MALTAKTLTPKVAALLLDADNIRWTPEELRSYISEAQRKIIDIKPDANAQERTLDLVAGTAQELPSDMLYLLDVLYNDTTLQEHITQVGLREMDSIDPQWRSENKDSVVVHYMYDPDTHPDIFYVYPAQPDSGTGSIRVLASVVPADLTSDTDVLVLRDRYEPAIIDYMIYKAYLKDNEEPNNQERSAGAYQRFLGAIGVPDGTRT